MSVDQPAERQAARPIAAVIVVAAAVGCAASLVAVYEGMRYVMVNNGGFCASGGPYQINPNQVCDQGAVWLLMGGVFIGIVFGFALVASSVRFAGIGGACVGLLLWAALFGALGWNFIDLAINPPPQMSGTGGWWVSGIVFWLMALGGLIPGLVLLFKSLKDPDDVEFKERFNTEPLVRAKIPGRDDQ